VPASRRMGVHAPDIKEEFKEFKEYWRGAALARTPANPRYLLFGRPLPETVEKQAAPGNYSGFMNSGPANRAAKCGDVPGSRLFIAFLGLTRAGRKFVRC
jgi:hypothetical protein